MAYFIFLFLLENTNKIMLIEILPKNCVVKRTIKELLNYKL